MIFRTVNESVWKVETSRSPHHITPHHTTFLVNRNIELHRWEFIFRRDCVASCRFAQGTSLPFCLSLFYLSHTLMCRNLWRKWGISMCSIINRAAVRISMHACLYGRGVAHWNKHHGHSWTLLIVHVTVLVHCTRVQIFIWRYVKAIEHVSDLIDQIHTRTRDGIVYSFGRVLYFSWYNKHQSHLECCGTIARGIATVSRYKNNRGIRERCVNHGFVKIRVAKGHMRERSRGLTG